MIHLAFKRTMVKYYTGIQVFKFTWDQVASSFWQRYPNPYSKHVLTEDVISREVIDKKLYTKRLLTKTNPVPKWGERFVRGPPQICIVEESIVDPIAKTVTTYTRNIGLQRLMLLEEKCVYLTNPENNHWTVCERWAYINSTIFGFSRAIQAFGLERYKKNVTKANQGFQHILEKCYLPETSEVKSQGKLKLKQTAIKASQLARHPVLSAASQIS